MSLFREPDRHPLDKHWAKGEIQKHQRAVMRLAAFDSLVSAAIGQLEHNTTLHFASGGAWSTHELIRHILAQTGPADIAAATWSLSDEAVNALVGLLDSGAISSLAFLVDYRVQIHCPGAYHIAKHRATEMRVTRCHAKTTVITNAEWNLSIVGSSNFTNNPRIEAGVIVDDPDVAAFHRGWILAEIANSAPFGMDMRKAKPYG